MWTSGKAVARPWLRLLATQQPALPKSTMSKRKPVRIYYPQPRTDPTRDVYQGGPAPDETEALREAAVGRRAMNRPGQARVASRAQVEREEPTFRVQEPDSYQGRCKSNLYGFLTISPSASGISGLSFRN